MAVAGNWSISILSLSSAYEYGVGVDKRSFAMARMWRDRATAAQCKYTSECPRMSLEEKMVEAAAEASASADAAELFDDFASALTFYCDGVDAGDGPLTRKFGLALLRGKLCKRDLVEARAHLERSRLLSGVTEAENFVDIAELEAAEAKSKAAAEAVRKKVEAAQERSRLRQAALEAAFLARKAAKEAQIKADLAKLIRDQEAELDAKAKASGKPLRRLGRRRAAAAGEGAGAGAGAGAPGAPPVELLLCAACEGKPADEYSKSQLRLAVKRKCRHCIEEAALR